jgi:hypothetical protein
MTGNSCNVGADSEYRAMKSGYFLALTVGANHRETSPHQKFPLVLLRRKRGVP